MSSFGNDMSPADVAAVIGNRGYGYGGYGVPMVGIPYGNGGYGNGFGGDASWLVVFLALMMFGGFGGGWGMGGMGGGMPWLMAGQQQLGAQMNSGFDNAAVMGQLGGIQNAITGGFGSQEVAACNRAMDSLAAQYTNQIAELQRSFAAQTDVGNRLDSIAMSLQNCCCENRAATADLKYTVATEACADRAAVTAALTAVTQQMNAGFQSILTQMSSDKLDAKNEKIAELQQQIYMKDLAASQIAQTAQLENFIRANTPATAATAG